MNDYEATPQISPILCHGIALGCGAVIYLGIALGFCWVLS